MFSKSNSPKSGNAGQDHPQKPAIPSIISPDVKLVGNLASDGQIDIFGSIDGDIRSHVLLIGETANIKGEIIADSIIVHGTLTGQIKARLVTLAKTARVTGDILHEDLAIEKGAFLDGHCKRLEEKKGAAEGRINLVIPGSNEIADAASSTTKLEGEKTQAATRS